MGSSGSRLTNDASSGASFFRVLFFFFGRVVDSGAGSFGVSGGAAASMAGGSIAGVCGGSERLS